MTVKTLTQVVNGRLEPTASQLDADLIEVSKISGNQIQIKEDGLFVPYSSGGGGSLPFSVVDWDVKSIDATPIGFTTSEGATYVDGSLSLYYNDTKIELNTYSVAYDKEQLIIQRDRDKFYLYGTGAYDPYPPIRIKVPIEGYTNWSNINIYVKYHGNTNGYFLNRAEVQLQLTNVNR